MEKQENSGDVLARSNIECGCKLARKCVFINRIVFALFKAAAECAVQMFDPDGK
jgi:hypothetical protein